MIISLPDASKLIKYVKIGYNIDMMEVVDAYRYLNQIQVEYRSNNILVMDPAKGYLLTDILNDDIDELNISFEQFYDIGYAIGIFIKKLHMSKTFPFNANHKTYQKIKNFCIREHMENELTDFEKNSGYASLIHGDLSPNNILIDLYDSNNNNNTDDDISNINRGKNKQNKLKFGVNFGVCESLCQKITLIDLDKFADSLKHGGLASYEFYQFCSGIDYVSKNSLNNSYLKNGFFMGYGNHCSTTTHTIHKLCERYWSLIHKNSSRNNL